MASAASSAGGQREESLSAKDIRNAKDREKRRFTKLPPFSQQMELLEQAVQSDDEKLAFKCGAELCFLFSSALFDLGSEECSIAFNIETIKTIIDAMKAFPLTNSGLSEFGCNYMGQTADRYSYQYREYGGSYKTLGKK